jgi:hypothetical protein
MNIPAAGQKIVIVGANGMVGGYALRYALGQPSVERVTAIGRKRLGMSHPYFRLDALRAVEYGVAVSESNFSESSNGSHRGIFLTANLGRYRGKTNVRKADRA